MGRIKIPDWDAQKKGIVMFDFIVTWLLVGVFIAGGIAGVMILCEQNGHVYNDEDESLTECHRCGEWYTTEEFGGSGACPYCPVPVQKMHHCVHFWPSLWHNLPDGQTINAVLYKDHDGSVVNSTDLYNKDGQHIKVLGNYHTFNDWVRYYES